ncbi:hypothetical protein DFH06DRAFT_1142895 [Mycena polygramma]|nr:hypothetical protein DFH06DRAFT_1142895 [Mycena polygramma]
MVLAEKAAGNQTDNAGFHSAAFWRAQRRGVVLKGQYALVKMLRNKSGWGWDNMEKHIVVEDNVWNVLMEKLRPGAYEMSQLMDGAVATGAGAFLPGRPADAPGSPAWSEELRDDDDDERDIPIDPVLLGPAGRVNFPAGDGGEDSDMDDGAQVSSVSRRPHRRPPLPNTAVPIGHGHGGKPSNGHTLMAVSDSLQGIAVALTADGVGPPSPKRKTEAVKIIMSILVEKFSKEERNLILRLIRGDTGITDLFLAIGDDMDARIDYLREELKLACLLCCRDKPPELLLGEFTLFVSVNFAKASLTPEAPVPGRRNCPIPVPSSPPSSPDVTIISSTTTRRNVTRSRHGVQESSVEASSVVEQAQEIRHSIVRAGARIRQAPPVSHGTLYLTAVRPPEREALQDHHKCGVCFEVKDHPVSHCYVCARLALEHGWRCPDCNTIMTDAPFRHYGEEKMFREAYPGRRLPAGLSRLVMSKSHKRRNAEPALYDHRGSIAAADVASVVRVSGDGRRASEQTVPVDRLRPPTIPGHFEEDMATNAALEAEDFGYDMGDHSLPAEEQGPAEDGISVCVKAKRYENSDLPFQTWVGYRQQYLEEMFRLEGRGNIDVYSTCGGCGEANPAFRCEHQSCYGPGMFCQECIVVRHQVLPTHWIQKWSAGFFQRVNLLSLGLTVQLGHTPGSACTTMRRGKYKFTVIDVTGIHNVAVQFCECDQRIAHWQQLMHVYWWPATVVDPSTCATFNVICLFQNMNCLGKISDFHFLRSLELLTNADGLNPLPNRRRVFMYIVRQHRMLEAMKRAGRGHSDSGIAGTAQGELALRCRACPPAGINLPDGSDKINWAAMPEDLSYKYFLYLAQDCNLRLINRDVSNETRDPIVDDGLGYFCNREGYKAFLRSHVDDEEISICSGFQAMFLANAKRVKGLRTTGVGGVTCARHNMWRANGIGDLQRGERYCNMDFILFSSLLNTIILFLILSYDIACQYSKTFWARMGGLPEAMRIDREKITVWFKVPNFHILGHKWPCHSPFSFHWMWGAGMTDGEDVEQNWEFTNGAAGSTKMMGPGVGTRFWKGLSYRRVFSRRMARNLKEARRHKEAFDAFTAVLTAEQLELVTKWRGWVKEWESKQHTDGHFSPFEMPNQVHTMKDIRLRLGKEELTRMEEGVEVERRHTSSTFVSMGLEIEQSQRILAIDVKALADPTPLQALEYMKRRTALQKRINRFRKLQKTYMPWLSAALTPTQRAVLNDKSRPAESTKLFLPSELAAGARAQACEKGLDLIEDEIREGELQETLEELRQALRTQGMMHCFKRHNLTGQRALTRGQGVLRQVTIRIHKAKLRDADLIDALRVEWCKAYARTRRLNEDIVLVEEEMRRTIEFGRVDSGTVGTVNPALAEGLRAYALEHVHREQQTCELLSQQWHGLREKGQAYLAGNRELVGETVVVDLGDAVDVNDVEGDVPGDERMEDDDGGALDDEADPEDI